MRNFLRKIFKEGSRGFGTFFVLLLSASGAVAEVGYGTGFAVTDEGHIITSRHVVTGAKQIKLYSANSRQAFKAVLMAESVENDLALLKVSSLRLIPLRLSESLSIPTGLEVLAFGFPQPGLQGHSLKISSGLINAREGFGGESGRFQFSAEIQRGHSGGAVVAKDGTVVGLIQGMLSQTRVIGQDSINVPQNVNFAIESSMLIAFLKEHGVSITPSPLNTRLEQPSYVLFDRVSPSLFLIEVERSASTLTQLTPKDVSPEARQVLRRLDKNDQGRFLGAISSGFKTVLDSKIELLQLEAPPLKGGKDSSPISFRSIVTFEEPQKHSKGFLYKSVILVSTYDCQAGRTLAQRLEYKQERFGTGDTLLKLKRASKAGDEDASQRKKIPERLKAFLEENLCVQ